MNKVRIYGAGGAGVTIAAKNIQQLVTDSFLDVEVKYIDTSRADINSLDVDSRDTYIISNSVGRDIDGSGGVRESLDKYITDAMPEYVDGLSFGDTDIHIVLSSASGGSGSLIAPRLIHNLKSTGAPVLYITLVDTSSIQYCETSIKTLKHIDLMGRKYGYSVPTMIVDNNDAIKVVNSRVGLNVELLSLLLSAKHKAIDSADNVMFASNGYDKDALGLVTLSLHTEDSISRLKGSLLSTLRVLTDDEYYKIDTNILDKVKQYKVGYPSEEGLERLKTLNLSVPLYFAITPNSSVRKIEAIKADLEEKLTIKEDKQEVFSDDEDIGVSI